MGSCAGMEQKPKRKWERYSEEEKAIAVGLYEESGLSRMAFCRRDGIGLSNLRRWIVGSRVKRTEGKNEKIRFVEVEAAEPAIEKARQYRLGNLSGMWVEFGCGFDAQELRVLAGILREAEEC